MLQVHTLTFLNSGLWPGIVSQINPSFLPSLKLLLLGYLIYYINRNDGKRAPLPSGEQNPFGGKVGMQNIGTGHTKGGSRAKAEVMWGKGTWAWE